VRIETAVRDSGVGNSSCNSINNNVGRLRVKASVNEGHLLKD
jgi:hypothetical protein